MQELLIDDEMKLEEIQSLFSDHFPFLQIRFYAAKLDPVKNSMVAGEPVKDNSKRLHELIHARLKEKISMNGNTKVKTFENNFEEAGIFIQVFRKSGNLWLQTTATDELTLSEINRIGEEMEQPIEPPAPQDIHEQA